MGCHKSLQNLPKLPTIVMFTNTMSILVTASIPATAPATSMRSQDGTKMDQIYPFQRVQYTFDGPQTQQIRCFCSCKGQGSNPTWLISCKGQGAVAKANPVETPVKLSLKGGSQQVSSQSAGNKSTKTPTWGCLSQILLNQKLNCIPMFFGWFLVANIHFVCNNKQMVTDIEHFKCFVVKNAGRAGKCCHNN